MPIYHTFFEAVRMQSRVNILTPKHDKFFECCCKRRGGGKKQMISPQKNYPQRTDDLVMNCTTLILDTVEIA